MKSLINPISLLDTEITTFNFVISIHVFVLLQCMYVSTGNTYYCFALWKYYHIICLYSICFFHIILFLCVCFFMLINASLSYLTATQNFHCINIINLFILRLIDTLFSMFGYNKNCWTFLGLFAAESSMPKTMFSIF